MAATVLQNQFHRIAERNTISPGNPRALGWQVWLDGWSRLLDGWSRLLDGWSRLLDGRAGSVDHSVDRSVKFVARREVRHLFGGHRDAGAGPGMAPRARLALARVEAAKSADLDLVAAL